MVDSTQPLKPYLQIKLALSGKGQIAPDATQIDGALEVIPRNFLEGTGPTDGSFKAILADGTGSMLEDETGNQNPYRNKRNDVHAGGEIALRALQPDDYFALYSFNKKGKRIFPKTGKPVQATPASVAAALTAWRELAADDQTYMSTGIELVLADFLSLAECDEGTVALVSDGFNNIRDERALRTALAKIKEFRVAGKTLKIQPVGIGASISLDQLELIRSECLADNIELLPLGTSQAKWGEVFAKIFNDLSAKKLRQVEICFVDMPKTAALLNFSQQRPRIEDLTGEQRGGKDEGSISIATGGWEAAARRLYSFSLGVQKPSTRDGVTAACVVIKYTIGRKVYELEPMPIDVYWTNIATLSNRIPPELAEAKGISGAVQAVTQGNIVLQQGNKAVAQELFQKAYDLGREAGALGFIRTLKEFMDIDEVTHKVTVRHLTKEASMRLQAASQRQDDDEG